MEKLKEKKGETLVETLIAALIMVMGMSMLAGALVSTAKLNSAVRRMTTMAQEKDVAGNGSYTKNVGNATVKFSSSGVADEEISVEIGRYGEEGTGVYEFYRQD